MKTGTVNQLAQVNMLHKEIKNTVKEHATSTPTEEQIKLEYKHEGKPYYQTIKLEKQGETNAQYQEQRKAAVSRACYFIAKGIITGNFN